MVFKINSETCLQLFQSKWATTESYWWCEHLITILTICIHDNLCYLTVKSDTRQHSQFLQCFLQHDIMMNSKFPSIQAVHLKTTCYTFSYSECGPRRHTFKVWRNIIRWKYIGSVTLKKHAEQYYPLFGEQKWILFPWLNPKFVYCFDR